MGPLRSCGEPADGGVRVRLDWSDGVGARLGGGWSRSELARRCLMNPELEDSQAPRLCPAAVGGGEGAHHQTVLTAPSFTGTLLSPLASVP